MPAYNAEKTIAASVESVLAQTFADFELIIVDDCSADETPSVCGLLAATDQRIRVLRNERNSGTAASRNRGVDEARGEWTAFLDSDDLWTADKLEKQLTFIEETGADISYTASAFMDEDGVPMKYIMSAKRELTYKGLLRHNLMSCSSVMVRRDIMQNTRFEDGPIHEDYAAWLRIVRRTGTAYGLDEPLLIYRVSKTSRSGRRVRSGMMVYRTYRSVGFGVLRSLSMTLKYSKHSISKRRKMRSGVNDLI
jgi:teichuronic acid biosynthesis glycosyltransferase TuaG